MFRPATSFHHPFRALLLGLCLAAASAGCAGRKAEAAASQPPPGTAAPAKKTVVATETPSDVHVVAEVPVDAPPPDNPEVIGYAKFSDGAQAPVVQYVHTYPDPIESYPRVYVGGTWYYNVNGDFVYYSPTFGTWVYFWGPPPPLVVWWNFYYPWVPYAWGVGIYGPGWYWGGVGIYGFHHFGAPVWAVYHHHHPHYVAVSRGRPIHTAARGRLPSRGMGPRPAHTPSGGTPPARMPAPEEPRAAAGAPGRIAATPRDTRAPGRAPVGAAGPGGLAASQPPARASTAAGRPGVASSHRATLATKAAPGRAPTPSATGTVPSRRPTTWTSRPTYAPVFHGRAPSAPPARAAAPARTWTDAPGRRDPGGAGRPQPTHRAPVRSRRPQPTYRAPVRSRRPQPTHRAPVRSSSPRPGPRPTFRAPPSRAPTRAPSGGRHRPHR